VSTYGADSKNHSALSVGSRKPLSAKRLQGYDWMGYCRGGGRGTKLKNSGKG